MNVKPRERVLSSLVVLLLLASPGSAARLLVIGDGDTEDSVVPLLQVEGHDVIVFSGTDSSFDGSTDLSTYDAVILLDGEGYQSGMPVGGQNALKAYVLGGGGLLLTEWVAFEFRNGRYGSMAELIPLRRSGGATLSETYTVQVAHEITVGLPASFSVPTQGFNVGSAVSGIVLVTGSSSGDAVVVDDYGTGRVVQMATAGNYSSHRPFDQGSASTNYNRLFVQAAEWVSGGPKCFEIDAIDDQTSLINDGSTIHIPVLVNDECDADQPITVVTEPGDLMPDRGGVAITDGTRVSYTPAAGFAGFEEFTYTARDAGLQGGTNPPAVDQDQARVVVNVLPDLVPDAVDDQATTSQGQAVYIDVLANDSVGNPPVQVTIESPPANGSASVQADDTIRYFSSQFGADSFAYRLTDVNGDSDVANVDVTVFFTSGEVQIDVMPNDDGNNLNLSGGPGAGFQVAILSVGALFPAPDLIDPLSLKLGPREANIWGSPQVRDVDRDGDEDLLVKFLTEQTGIACGDTHVRLVGRSFEFRSVFGTDSIHTFHCPRVRKRY